MNIIEGFGLGNIFVSRSQESQIIDREIIDARRIVLHIARENSRRTWENIVHSTNFTPQPEAQQAPVIPMAGRVVAEAAGKSMPTSPSSADIAPEVPSESKNPLFGTVTMLDQSPVAEQVSQPQTISTVAENKQHTPPETTQTVEAPEQPTGSQETAMDQDEMLVSAQQRLQAFFEREQAA